MIEKLSVVTCLAKRTGERNCKLITVVPSRTRFVSIAMAGSSVQVSNQPGSLDRFINSQDSLGPNTQVIAFQDPDNPDRIIGGKQDDPLFFSLF